MSLNKETEAGKVSAGEELVWECHSMPGLGSQLSRPGVRTKPHIPCTRSFPLVPAGFDRKGLLSEELINHTPLLSDNRKPGKRIAG